MDGTLVGGTSQADVAEVVETMECAGCGLSLHTRDRVCGNCGTRVGSGRRARGDAATATAGIPTAPQAPIELPDDLKSAAPAAEDEPVLEPQHQPARVEPAPVAGADEVQADDAGQGAAANLPEPVVPAPALIDATTAPMQPAPEPAPADDADPAQTRLPSPFEQEPTPRQPVTSVAPEPEPVGDPGAVVEETVFAPRRAATSDWAVAWGDGDQLVLTAPVAFGRAPTAPGQAPDARCVTVDDPDRTVSSTHALVEARADGVYVTDLGSINGTVVVGTDGKETQVEPGSPVAVPAGATIEIGAYPVYVARAQ